MNATLTDLQAALQKTDAQSILIFPNGVAYLNGSPRAGASNWHQFQSLPELSRFVQAVNGPVAQASEPAVSHTSSLPNPS